MAKLGRAAAKGFVRGREEMRTMAAQEFARLGAGYFTGTEVAQFLVRMPGPKPEDVENHEEDSEKTTRRHEEETEKVPS